MNIPPIQFVVYLGGSNMWRVQAVPIRPNSFEVRTPLKEEWRGLFDDNLIETSGIQHCVFVRILQLAILNIILHILIDHNGWIGGNRTKEGAIEMAKKTLRL